MIEDQLVSNMDVGVVDARMAAEAISFTYMQCILKGLQRAPKIITDRAGMNHHSVLTAADVFMFSNSRWLYRFAYVSRS